MAKDKRFTKVYAQGALGGLEIFVDNETSVQYLFIQSGYGGGLTVLVDQEGKPLLYKPDRQKSSPEL
ncbi:MAG: xylan 1,4-beta-xylosidase [Oscillospiraceae bacterium]|nr:xylan 1,4-beta-xylosidase [Oscillospiraceae bacterium]MBR0211908.1 xylan 1,4-beta-xylosidase [Oscillospiraceae bacterium]